MSVTSTHYSHNCCELWVWRSTREPPPSPSRHFNCSIFGFRLPGESGYWASSVFFIGHLFVSSREMLANSFACVLIVWIFLLLSCRFLCVRNINLPSAISQHIDPPSHSFKSVPWLIRVFFFFQWCLIYLFFLLLSFASRLGTRCPDKPGSFSPLFPSKSIGSPAWSAIQFG